MTAIAQLEENRTVEGVYAVAKKQRMHTKNGAPYLALELVDPSGRISARVWNDVELLDTRFAEGDAVRVLGRVERFRDRLQLDVRTLEPRRTSIRRRWRRRCGATRTSSRASSSSSQPRSRIPACRRSSNACSTRMHAPRSAFFPRRSTGTTRTRAGCSSTPSVSRRSAARPRNSINGFATIFCLRPRSCTTSGACSSSAAGPVFRQTDEGRLLGHVHLGLRLIEERGEMLDTTVRAEVLHAVSCHHDVRGARTAEAAVLYHANQLDAVAATRPVNE